MATELIFDFGQGGIISALEEVREKDGSLKEVKVEVDDLIDERFRYGLSRPDERKKWKRLIG